MAVVLIRATILYIIITFSLRLMGKRQLGELQPVGTGGDDTHIQHRGNTRGGFFGADDTGDSSDIHAGLP